MTSPRNIAVFGSTGSIGVSALDVVRQSPDALRVVALSAHTQVALLLEQAQQFQVPHIVITDEQAADGVTPSQVPPGTELHVGSEALEMLATHEDVEVVVAAIVGIAGLRSTWAALEAGKRVALANKETLVVAGSQVNALVRCTGAELLPVDSEHSAIYQALRAGRREDLSRVILTSSGGPFRGYNQQQLARVTLEQALAHPTWDMGQKITVDSATMMNKALEVIEARWLFDLSADQIEVVIHPQSIVHSMVEFVDGSVVAQMSPPDMRMPIQLALTDPERWPCPAPKMDFTRPLHLDFTPPDIECFPATELGIEVAAAGGSAGAVVNAANEAAVKGFIDGRIEFIEIVPICRKVLERHQFESNPTLEQLFQLDAWARSEVNKWVCT